MNIKNRIQAMLGKEYKMDLTTYLSLGIFVITLNTLSSLNALNIVNEDEAGM